MVVRGIDGGATAVQYRNKSRRPARCAARQAQALAKVCRQRGALFIVNDDPSLGTRSRCGRRARRRGTTRRLRRRALVVKEGRVVGVSCYDDLGLRRVLPARLRRRLTSAFGSFFPSRVKPDARRADVSLVRAAKSLGVPVVGIGGITAQNAPMLVDAGIDAVAVISDVFAHDDLADIAQAAARIAACFES
jgi:thiamine-phosphate pyrophosphorylase